MPKDLSTESLLKILDSTSDINTYIDIYDSALSSNGFPQHINKLAEEKNCSIAEIIIRGAMNESYCYQLFKGTRKPSRDKVIQICFGMSLNLMEANKLLQKAEKSELYCKNKRDAIIIFGLNNKLGIMEVEEILIEKMLESLVE